MRTQNSDQTGLRQRAERIYKTMSFKNKQLASETDILKEMHELQVHQIELELQNEDLLLANERAEIAEKKYTGLYESAPSGYITLSKEGDIMELNPSAARLLNKEAAKLINTRFALFISEETQNVFNHFFDRVLKSQQKETCEAMLKTYENPPIYLNIEGNLTQDNNFCLLTIMDITKCKQAEEAMLKLKVANEAIKFKQSFLANISHEMRTPLTGILGMIDIMEQTKLTATQKDYISTLKHSGENLKEIINQVLDFSKIEAGKVILKPCQFSLKTLLDETKILLKGRVKPGVELKTSADPNIPSLIYADESRIRQVINNLVANALKFTNTGSVVINSQLLFSNPHNREIILKISVTDTGIGIPENLQNKLFLPFSQIEDNDTRNYEGTGLGLSICKKLVMLLGGEIGFESETQKGSTFWFTFPALLIEVPGKITKNGGKNELLPSIQILNQDQKIHNQSLNILYAEDKVVNQKVISLILKSMGHVVTIACDGKQVLDIFKPGVFDLILMDIQMPVMDGITATKKLKEKYKILPPIVGLSANAFEGDRDKYMVLGMDEYLTKPINKEKFNDLLNRLQDLICT
jgi:PAS domain S-box-containing protein